MPFGFIFIALSISINCKWLFSGKHFTCEYNDTRVDFHAILLLCESIGFKAKMKYFQGKKKIKIKHLNECMQLERILKYLCC